MEYILGILALLIVIGYYGEKWLRQYRIIQKSKFKDAKSEFVADIYKLQQKWSRRGEHDYVEFLDLLKKALHLPPEEKMAETEYGRQFQKDIKEAFSTEEQ